MGPEALSQVLRQVGVDDNKNEKILVGLNKPDDASAYQLDDERVLLQSVDYFTPIVDDPYLFGEIAAANALSDIYAMGGKPITAMNIVGFPECLKEDILVKILKGGRDKVNESQAVIAGGHTITDEEPKYGLSVTGLVNKDNLVTNSEAKVGDVLILTQALGTGIIATAIKGGMLKEDRENDAIQAMLTLNDQAVDIMEEIKVNACTDVTGFALLGHCWELAKGSQVGVELYLEQIPLFSQVKEFINLGMVPAGAYSNRDYLADVVEFELGIKEESQLPLFDPQTSGGLLLSVSADKANDLLQRLKDTGIERATVIGRVTNRQAKIEVKKSD